VPDAGNEFVVPKAAKEDLTLHFRRYTGMTPRILINGGSQSGGPWASGGYPAPGPDAIVDNMSP
jgi:hypothetical protein